MASELRSARFFPWLAAQDADVVCIQETKAQVHQLPPETFNPEGYHCFYNDAERPGYSGTALFSKVKPQRITTKLGWEPMDSQGRYLQADFPGLSVVSLYVPSGSSGDEAQQRKEVFMQHFFDHLKTLRRKRREFVICADWNICHREIDLKNWRANRKNSGFLPHERAWLDRVFDELGWVDVFRRVNPEPEQYTWWSNGTGLGQERWLAPRLHGVHPGRRWAGTIGGHLQDERFPTTFHDFFGTYRLSPMVPRARRD